jgi:uncharacterized protein (TIRG00374 family)
LTRKSLGILWLAVGLALVVLVVAWCSPSRTLADLRGALAHPLHLAAAAAAFVATQGVFLVKWHVMARRAGSPLGLRQNLRLFGTLMLVGTFTPARVGELAVPALMRGGGALTAVALVNRLLESTCTLCAGVLAALLILNVETFGSNLWGLGLVLALFVAAMVLLGRRRHVAAVLRVVRAGLVRLRGLRAARWLLAQEERYAAGIEHFYAANERLLRPGPMLLFALLMLLVWALMVTGNWCLIQATVPEGEKAVTVSVVIAIIAVMAVAMFLAPTPGGLGVSEFLSVAVFARLGYEGESFVAFLLLARVGMYAAVGILYAVSRIAGREVPAAGGA